MNQPTALTVRPASRLIGFGGKPGAGKDMCADNLVEHDGFSKVNFSTPLFKGLWEMNPWIETEEGFTKFRELVFREGLVEAKTYPDVRQLFQDFGTAARDLFGETVVLDAAAKEIDALHTEYQSAAITGVRTIAECDMIRSKGGVLIWVERPNLKRTVNSGHSIENSVKSGDFDFVIINEGSPDELFAKVEKILATHELVSA